MTRFYFLVVLCSLLFSGCAMTSPRAISGTDSKGTALRATVEAQRRDIEQLNTRLSTLEQNLAEQQKQVAALQAATAAQKVTYTGENTISAGHTTGTEAEQAPASATKIYLKAFGDYASGRYHQGIKGFESFYFISPPTIMPAMLNFGSENAITTWDNMIAPFRSSKRLSTIIRSAAKHQRPCFVWHRPYAN